MVVKMIAVDMDGTFLNDKMEYNRERFNKIYQEMKLQGMHFVVASGNQYYQLRSFFPDIAKEISFVSENGAYVIHADKEIFCAKMDDSVIRQTLNVLSNYPEAMFIVCGKESAYAPAEISNEAFQYANKYYHRLKRVSDLYEVSDTLYKFALTFPPSQAEKAIHRLKEDLGDKIIPVSSGHGDIDLILPGVHKANGLQKLQKVLNVHESEIVAFGDSGNDMEMLKFAGCGVAMANGAEIVKEIADEITDSNNDEGVLNKLEALLKSQVVVKEI